MLKRQKEKESASDQNYGREISKGIMENKNKLTISPNSCYIKLLSYCYITMDLTIQ